VTKNLAQFAKPLNGRLVGFLGSQWQADWYEKQQSEQLPFITKKAGLHYTNEDHIYHKFSSRAFAHWPTWRQ
jgi:hypothetical protein